MKRIPLVTSPGYALLTANMRARYTGLLNSSSANQTSTGPPRRSPYYELQNNRKCNFCNFTTFFLLFGLCYPSALLFSFKPYRVRLQLELYRCFFEFIRLIQFRKLKPSGTTSDRLVNGYRRGRSIGLKAKMEALRSSQTSVCNYQSIRRHTRKTFGVHKKTGMFFAS